jgi:arylsulfatase A-like enzyme
MRAIMVMFDSLSKRMLPIYGNDEVVADNFRRLNDTTTVFNNFYGGSMPCMPARRELHTGRYNFLHRSWGPLEPFDDSMPELLKDNGVYTHLVSDHLHYWDDGGATYHRRYSSWECVRGQVADAWVGKVAAPDVPEHYPTMREFTHPQWWRNYWKNRRKIIDEDRYPQNRTFNGGIKFLEDNKDEDNWFLQIETFDPHEPFDVPEEFIKLYEEYFDRPFFNSPPYGVVNEDEGLVQHAQALYAALTSMCDRNLGRVLDFMDQHDMWKDTMLIINTDHGLFVGEKDWWAKSVMPCYNEVINTPFCIWDPRVRAVGKRDALAQTIDIAPTLLDFFNVPIPKDMQGKVMTPAIENDTRVRDTALFGYAGSFINITDGRYTYMRASQSLGNQPHYEYTLMPTTQGGFLKNEDLQQTELAPPFEFTKGNPVLKIPFASKMGAPIFCNSFQFDNLLWDLENDPEQESPVKDTQQEAQMINLLLAGMKATDAPADQYARVGLEPDKSYTAEDVQQMEKSRRALVQTILGDIEWEREAVTLFVALAGLMTEEQIEKAKNDLKEMVGVKKESQVSHADVVELVHRKFSRNPHAARYFINKLMRIR